MQIAIVGCGYVGLVSGACLADVGHRVTCVDRDITKIAALRAGKVPIYEPGLEDLVNRGAASGRLAFNSDLSIVVGAADAVFISVGTPLRAADGAADLTNVYAVVDQIAGIVRRGATIVLKSTVPVGTAEDVEHILRRSNPTAEISVISNPEFLRQGAAIADFMKPDRIVVGFNDPNGRAVIEEIYKPFAARGVPILFTSRRSSELIKYAANAFLAVKLTFINEIADLCEAAGADVVDVSMGIGLDRRIGTQFLGAGPGYGGSCLPKDTHALLRSARGFGAPLRTIETIVSINEARARTMAGKVAQACGGSVRGKTVAFLGLTFKPGTDDIRGSPAISIIRELERAGGKIRAFDPMGMENAARLLPNVTVCRSPYEAGAGADVAVIATEWDIFRTLNLAALKAAMRVPALVDFRNVYEREYVEAAGMAYTCIGRGVPKT